MHYVHTTNILGAYLINSRKIKSYDSYKAWADYLVGVSSLVMEHIAITNQTNQDSKVDLKQLHVNVGSYGYI